MLEEDQDSGGQMVLLWQLKNLLTTATPSLRITKSGTKSYQKGHDIMSTQP